MRGCHIVTPSKRGKSHYWWGAAFDVPSISEEVAAKTKASVVAAFNEDKELLQKLQANVAADPRGLDFLEVTLGADGAGIKVRQILNKKLSDEGRTLS
jgi:vanillate O-demethylase monooxygenase subunit